MLFIEEKPITEIEAYPGNAKEHPPEQIKQIAASIKEFGFNDPNCFPHEKFISRIGD